MNTTPIHTDIRHRDAAIGLPFPFKPSLAGRDKRYP